MIVSLLLAITALGYLLASVGFQYNLFHRQQRDWGRWMQLVLASNAVHTLALGFLTMRIGHLPLNSMNEAIASLAWIVTVVYIFVGHSWKVDALGTVAAPAAAVMTAFSSIALEHDNAGPAQGPWLLLHVGSLVASYAAFCLAAFCAMLYFYQSRRLKKKQLGRALMLPSLDTLDRVAFRFILVGFPLMVLGVVSGTLISGWRWTWDAKETLVGATCAVYLLYLHARMIAGWQGRRVNLILLVAFFGVLISLLAPGQFHPL